MKKYETTIGAVAKRIGSGITPSRTNSKFWENGTISWLKTEQLGTHEIYETSEKITEVALKNTSIKIYPENTLTIAMYGEGKTRGNVSIIKRPMTTNQACCNIIVDEKTADYEFLYYYLKTQYTNFRQLSSGVRKNLNSNDIREFAITIPKDLSDQKAIAAVLSSLDAKIALNNRINAELEAMAKALYDYWFVQFDFPNAKGKPYKSSGGKMVWNEELKREIPEGWACKSVSQLLEIRTGKEDANYATENGEYNFYTCGESILRCDNFAFEGKAVLLAGNGTFSVKRYDGKFNAYQRTYVLIPKDEEVYPSLYFAVCDRVKKLASGSRGSIVKFITKGDIEDIRLALPDEGSIAFSGTLTRMFEKSANLEDEVEELTALRDWLLPMLMNGQVKVV